MKQIGRGFVLHGFPWGCYNCCCRVCTGRACPEHNKIWGWYRYHCAPCARSNGEMHIVLDCDFFENKHTSSRRFRIKRRWHRNDAVVGRLDAILKNLGIEYQDKKG